jgi:ABC-type multidrug transport system ATPase subunit
MYSSGMKQRVKLALTVLCNVPIVLLDEPTSNLDPTGRQWYKQLIETFIENRTLIVASNFLEEEYFFANAQITLADYQ